LNDNGWLVAVAAVLVVAVPFDLYVAFRFIRAAIERPHIPVLTLAALRSGAIAVAAVIAGILGLQSIVLLQTGVRVLPTPWPTVLLAVALVVISLPNVYALRVLNRGGGEE
jgi:hypothetical protein